MRWSLEEILDNTRDIIVQGLYFGTETSRFDLPDSIRKTITAHAVAYVPLEKVYLLSI